MLYDVLFVVGQVTAFAVGVPNTFFFYLSLGVTQSRACMVVMDGNQAGSRTGVIYM